MLQVDGYTLGEVLAQGPASAVMAATDGQGRDVVLKLLRAEDPATRRRFLREARLHAGLSHPRLVPLWAVLDHPPGLVMPRAPGPSLAAFARQARPTPEVARQWLMQLLEALEVVHAAGLVHRDLTPANLYLGDGGLVLGDFGLAVRVDGAGSWRTETGMGMGTPGYAAPEMWTDAGQADARADLFSVGIIWFELLFGHRPFGDDPAAFLAEVARGVPDEVDQLPAPERAVLRGCLGADPADRFDGVAEVRHALAGGGLRRWDEPEAGASVGPFVLLERLGRGAGAVVFLARHTETGRQVALKMPTRSDPVLLDRLHREASLQGGLNHPNIVTVEGLLTHEERPVLVMEAVLGGTLRAAMPLAPDRVDGVLAGVVAGLGAAHGAGLVHRDLKPENVLLTLDGQPKIADFGLVRQDGAEAGAALTATGEPVGTPAYMAPEQVQARRDVDQRADVWALGALASELATGQQAFVGAGRFAVYDKVVRGVWLGADDLAPHQRAAVQSALCVDPALRTPDVTRFWRQWSAQLPAQSPGPAWWKTLVPMGLAGLLLIGLGLLFVGPFVEVDRDEGLPPKLAETLVASSQSPALASPTAPPTTPAPRPAPTAPAPAVPSPQAAPPNTAPDVPSLPAAAPESEAPPLQARVAVQSAPGEAAVAEAFLHDGQRPFALGEVPAGSYELRVAFVAGEPARRVMRLALTAGQDQQIRCAPSMRVCK